MKTLFALIFGASITLSPQLVAAQSDEYCIAIEKFAATIMRERQEDTRSVGEQLSIVQESDMPYNVKGVSRSLILEAYGQPAYDSEEIREKSIKHFANYVAVTCYGGATN